MKVQATTSPDDGGKRRRGVSLLLNTRRGYPRWPMNRDSAFATEQQRVTNLGFNLLPGFPYVPIFAVTLYGAKKMDRQSMVRDSSRSTATSLARTVFCPSSIWSWLSGKGTATMLLYNWHRRIPAVAGDEVAVNGFYQDLRVCRRGNGNPASSNMGRNVIFS